MTIQINTDAARLAPLVLALVNGDKMQKEMKRTYKHIKQPFTISDVQEFLNGNIRTTPDGDVPRGYQVMQAVFVYGAVFKDTKTGTPDDMALHDFLWKIGYSAPCKYCRKPIDALLLYPQSVCHRSRCMMMDFRENC